MLAIALLILAAPVMLLIAHRRQALLARPVLYRQERVTWNGERFQMLKFRTMPIDAEAASGPVWSRHGERRATPFGAFLRRTSLDELPQFFNVLQRRDVARRPASRAAGIRRAIPPADPRLHAEAPRQGGHHAAGRR